MELNLDVLVGPTHLHGGLSYGNIASHENKLKKSHPKKAALEGLEKMKTIHDMGVVQLVLPPQRRPRVDVLQQCGYSAKEAYEKAPDLLYQCSSSSSMWAANAATTTASSDSRDGKVHISIANLASNLHRSLEAESTYDVFKKVFAQFVVHPPLPSSFEYFDEGAANHTRFSNGINFFVWGRSLGCTQLPKIFPARQTLEAQKIIAKRHQLDPKNVIYAQAKPKTIDAGVFHNDVIATGHENLFFVHEDAYVDTKEVLRKLRGIESFVVTRKELPVHDAVSSYIFNSQIVTVGSRRIMICPAEVKRNKKAYAVVQRFDAIDEVRFININQSMKNGGGPACLRLRMWVTDEECRTIHRPVFFTMRLYNELKKLITRYYPDTITLRDVLEVDPSIYNRIYELLSFQKLL